MSDSYWKERIATLKSMVSSYDDALLAFATKNIQSYTLDTGQNRQTVQRAEVSSLKNVRAHLLSELDSLMARTGDAHSYHRDAW